MPRPYTARQARDGAEERYDRYVREMRGLLQDADGESRRGNWREAAVKLQAAGSTLAAAAGTAQLLDLLYQMTEE
jgi:hypothetical protein